MTTSFDVPWNRYALIVELADRLKGKSPQFGKTALQKMVYLLQEVYGIDCGYVYEFYSYGPFSSQLLQDLDLVEHVGAVEVCSVMSATGGYLIKPGGKADALREKAADFLKNPQTEQALSTLVDEFGRYSAKELELRSTIVYVVREIALGNHLPSAEEVSHVVSQLKPKFDGSEINQAIEEMRSKGHITLSG